MTNRDIVKGYFETGDFPTQSQFWMLFDSIWFKDEAVFSNRIQATGQGQINMPAGTWIDKIGIVNNQDITVSIGTFPNGDDVLSAEHLSGTQGFTKDVYFDEPGILYFTGILPATKIIIFTR